jgi:hypothetical protein
MSAIAFDRLQPAMFVLHVLPGTLLAGVVAMAATLVSTLHGGPQLLYALVFGVAFHYLSGDPRPSQGSSSARAMCCAWAWVCWGRESPPRRSQGWADNGGDRGGRRRHDPAGGLFPG